MPGIFEDAAGCADHPLRKHGGSSKICRRERQKRCRGACLAHLRRALRSGSACRVRAGSGQQLYPLYLHQQESGDLSGRGPHKSSHVLAHKPGTLYQVLSLFNALGINLNKLESRPIPERDFEFAFYFDLDTSIYSPDFLQLMAELPASASSSRISEATAR